MHAVAIAIAIARFRGFWRGKSKKKKSRSANMPKKSNSRKLREFPHTPPITVKSLVPRSVPWSRSELNFKLKLEVKVFRTRWTRPLGSFSIIQSSPTVMNYQECYFSRRKTCFGVPKKLFRQGGTYPGGGSRPSSLLIFPRPSASCMVFSSTTHFRNYIGKQEDTLWYEWILMW